MTNNILVYLIIILLILKIFVFNKHDDVQNDKVYIENYMPYNIINNKKKQIKKHVRFNENSNEYYDNNNSEGYTFNYKTPNDEIPFMNNLNSWYNNTWIDHFDDDNNPVYKSSNTDINNSKILIDKDIDYTKDLISTKIFNNKSIKDIYDSLIFDY